MLISSQSYGKNFEKPNSLSRFFKGEIMAALK
jgi:hypothetical protein